MHQKCHNTLRKGAAFTGGVTGLIATACLSLAGIAPASASAQTSAAQTPPARDQFVGNEYLGGVWAVNSKGTDYGPWQDLGANKLAVQFMPADASGVMHGFVLGKPIVFLGRKVGSTGFRGIWMETTQPGVVNPTGRWGLASAQVGIAGRSIQIALSMGYRKPVLNSAGPGFPGRTLSGTYYMNANPATGLPSRGGVLKAWQKLVSDPGPFPNMRGVYPDTKIEQAIEAWTRNEKLVASWGSTTTVDPCAATCMGREPVRIGFAMNRLIPHGFGWSELYGRVVVAPASIETGKPARQLLDGQGRRQVDIFSVRREEAKKVHGADAFMGISPPEPMFRPCSEGGFTARYVLPTGVWTDPLADIRPNLAGTIRERDPGKGNDEIWKIVTADPGLKRTLADIYLSPKRFAGAGDVVVGDATREACYSRHESARGGASFFLKIHVF